MRKFKITKDDCRRLIEILQAISSQKSKSMAFSEVMMLNKSANDLIDANSEYLEQFNKVARQRQVLIDAGYAKVAEYRKTLVDNFGNDDKIDVVHKNRFDEYQQMVVAQLNDDIRTEVVPKLNALAQGAGADILDITLSEDKTKVAREKLEAFGLETDNNAQLITRLYDALTSADKEV